MTRLIDADVMRQEWLENGENEYVYDTNAILDSIDAQPTIEAEPVKHGKWTQTYASWSQNYDTSKNIRYRCSECNGIAVWDTKYCPNCGARMDGE